MTMQKVAVYKTSFSTHFMTFSTKTLHSAANRRN